MTNLAKCPCGETPTALVIISLDKDHLWYMANPNCCGEWPMPFFLIDPSYTAIKALSEVAQDAWNAAPRADGG